MQKLQTTKSNDYQLRRSLKAMSGIDEVMHVQGGIEEILHCLFMQEALSVPFACEDVFVLYDRIPVLSGALHPKKSPLITLMMDRQDETGLVVDSMLSGQESLWFAKIISGKSEVTDWLFSMQRPNLVVKPIESDLSIMIAPLAAFMTKRESY